MTELGLNRSSLQIQRPSTLSTARSSDTSIPWQEHEYAEQVNPEDESRYTRDSQAF